MSICQTLSEVKKQIEMAEKEKDEIMSRLPSEKEIELTAKEMEVNLSSSIKDKESVINKIYCKRRKETNKIDRELAKKINPFLQERYKIMTSPKMRLTEEQLGAMALDEMKEYNKRISKKDYVPEGNW